MRAQMGPQPPIDRTIKAAGGRAAGIPQSQHDDARGGRGDEGRDQAQSRE